MVTKLKVTDELLSIELMIQEQLVSFSCIFYNNRHAQKPTCTVNM